LRRILLIFLLLSCKYKLPESRVGDYVWFGEIWTDTLDTSIVYFDTVYSGSDKLGYGMRGGVVWFVVGDTSDTACSRDFRDSKVYQFNQSEEFDKQYRYTFFNWDDSLNDRVFKEGRVYKFCAANLINGVARETLKLNGVFPSKPRFSLIRDTLYFPNSDTLRIDQLPDTLYVGRTYTIVWDRGYRANYYMVRLVGRDSSAGYYYCYKEILDTTPKVSFRIPESSGDCYYDVGPINLEVVNVNRVIFDWGYAFGEFRFMSRITKKVLVRP
jgi:hypothetical protein